ncbi:hemolysin family protein [Caulobacter endophyticus]|uniref:Magnesium/cobalt efflux protein n=1 Tax=Caulobacter endophyticus TaxID=2172652 RepID=A0A2T9K1R5_9CAUL|nr:hemolysin family protein [Caulobacter endophyticus]PVM89919.1 magnesium/cobalt efflux protein [Caulobacter endophyticus]
MPDDDQSSTPAGPARLSRGLRAFFRELRRAAPVKRPRPVDPDHAPAPDFVDQAEAFKTLKVGDLMTPRPDLVAVEVETPFAVVVAQFVESGHSRMPIYREALDHPIGVVHVKDVFRLLADGDLRPEPEDRVLETLRRDMFLVPASMRAADLLQRMRTKRVHMAMVIDEFGGVDGLVTMEDLIESVVGDIDDEHDDAQVATVIARPGGVFETEGRTPLEDLEAALGETLAPPEHEEEVDTVGGLVAALAGQVPEPGQVVRHPAGFEVEVVEADARRVLRVRVRRAPEPAEAQISLDPVDVP